MIRTSSAVIEIGRVLLYGGFHSFLVGCTVRYRASKMVEIYLT